MHDDREMFEHLMLECMQCGLSWDLMLKIINNAKCFQKIREEFGSFCVYIWAYSDNKTILYNEYSKAGDKEVY